MTNNFAVSVPAKTPADIVAALEAALKKAIEDTGGAGKAQGRRPRRRRGSPRPR